jgi:hypothetical protein
MADLWALHRNNSIAIGPVEQEAPKPSRNPRSARIYQQHPIPLAPLLLYPWGMKKIIPSHQAPSASARSVSPLAPLLACCGVLALFAGCADEPESHMLSAPPPPTPTRSVLTTTTTTTPVAVATPVIVGGNPAYVTTASGTPVVSTVVVTEAPPALQQEIVLAQPSPQHVWLAGYWSWRDSRYVWMAGRWELPPTSSSVWVTPRWEQQGNAYKFYEGYWN